MKANLIKHEQDLDNLHPKKTVLNVKSKNGTMRQKALNKLTTKTPLEEDLESESFFIGIDSEELDKEEEEKKKEKEKKMEEEKKKEMLKEEELSDEDRIRSVLEKVKVDDKNRVQYLFDLIEGYYSVDYIVSDDESMPK